MSKDLIPSVDGRVVAGLPQPPPSNMRVVGLSPAAAKQHADIRAVVRPALRRSERQYQQAALSRWVKTVVRMMKEEGRHVADVAPGILLAAALDDVVGGYKSNLLTPEHPKKGNPPSNEEWILWVHVCLAIEIAIRMTPEKIALESAVRRAIEAIDEALKEHGHTSQSVVNLLPGSGREPPNAKRRAGKIDRSQQQVAIDRFVDRCIARRDTLSSGDRLPGGKEGQIAKTFREGLEALKHKDCAPAALAKDLDYVAGVTAHLLLARRRG